VHDAAVRSGTSYQLLLEREFDAPRDLVFEVWSEPKHLANWWGPNGFSMPFCEVDFRVGCQYRICMRSPEGEDHWLRGEYKVIDQPQRLVFTWLRENADGSVWCDTLVEISFEGAAERTRFRMHQTGFGSAAHRDEHRGGWSECLNRLADYVSIPK
jgi:uncharacterized protein YndB with AHSA1/START domain